MFTAQKKFIPVLTSEAGLCLTGENWQETKITMVSCSLERLLYKPGLDLLKTIQDLPRFLGWKGALVLNAMMLQPNKNDGYILCSPYDGSKIKLRFADLLELIQHLKPQTVLLPKNLIKSYPNVWQNWDESIIPLIHVDDLRLQECTKTHGAYFVADEKTRLAWDDFTQELALWSHLPRYVVGRFTPDIIQELVTQGIDCVESDEPAHAALQGKVYSQTGLVDLAQETNQMLFDIIDKECPCPTCTEQFTKAYLYHLLQNTPLLCQRFLIQHNMTFIQRTLGNYRP